MHPNQAIERYERELARRPNDVSLRIGLGDALRMLGELDEAEVEFQRALEVDAQNYGGLGSLGPVGGEREDIPEAIRCSAASSGVGYRRAGRGRLRRI